MCEICGYVVFLSVLRKNHLNFIHFKNVVSNHTFFRCYGSNWLTFWDRIASPFDLIRRI